MNRGTIRRGAGLLLFIMAGWMGISTARAVEIIASTLKPTGNVLTNNTTDGTSAIATEAEEYASATKYAIGQSFTTTTASTLDKISVQYRAFSSSYFMDSDATVKLVLFTYDSAGFDAASWGTYSSPNISGTVYTEEFGATFANTDKLWLTFDLTANQSLAAGTQYGFALWISNPVGGATSGATKNRMDLYYGGNYTGGGYLRVTSTGNEVSTSDLNFVLQEAAPAAKKVTLFIMH